MISDKPVGYREAETWMEARADAVASGTAPECVWLLEHSAMYTAGPSADPRDLREPDRFPVFPTRRGGQYTYHGPGQRVIYLVLDVGARGRDLRQFVMQIEAWIKDTLWRFGLRAETRPGRVGLWVSRPDKAPLPDGSAREDKIAAVGIRMRKWVSFHGVSLNVEPDLEHFDGIVPCGISDHGVTSLVDLGLPVAMEDVDLALRTSFEEVFGTSTQAVQAPHLP